MQRLVLILGGVRSGKSRFAEQLAERVGGEDVLFVATAEAGDREMRERIEHHRRSRPAQWRTLEQPLGTGQAVMGVESRPAVILVDCLTLLVSNALLESKGEVEQAEKRVTEETDALLAAARHHRVTMIVVSGEVGQGIVPESAMGRAFRDLLGRANQRLAKEADVTYWMVAGMAVEVGSLATSVEQAAKSIAPQTTAKEPKQPFLKRLFSTALSRLHLFIALILFCAAMGCREQNGPATTASGPTSERQSLLASKPSAAVVTRTADTITVTDLLGRRVRLHPSPRRIVSLSPSLTEILFAIGAGDRIVGATEFCDYPPETKKIPHVGGGTLESLNQEIIVALRPDLVLCKEDTHEPLVRNLERLEIPVLALGPDTMEQLYGHTEMLGEITGHTDRATGLIESMQRRVAAVASRLPDGERPTIFYQVWDEPLMTAGADSYIGEVLRLAGGRNLFEDSPIRYPKVSREVVVSEDPDVILAPETHSTPVTLESIRSRPGWSQIRAVRENRVYVIDGDPISRCGPRLIDALEEIVRLLYPDRFPPTASRSSATEAPQKTSPANSESQERLP